MERGDMMILHNVVRAWWHGCPVGMYIVAWVPLEEGLGTGSLQHAPSLLPSVLLTQCGAPGWTG